MTDRTKAGASNIQLVDHDIPAHAEDSRLIVRDRAHTPQAAAFRVLKYQIEHRTKARSILVTSPSHGHGISQTALNLALTSGEDAKQPVLLLESNAPYQSLASILFFSPPICFLQQCIDNQASPQSAWTLVNIVNHNVHVGAISLEQKSHWTQMQAFVDGLESLIKENYSKIIIDGPPVLNSADANIIQDHVDSVLMVTKAKSTKESQLKEATHQLGLKKIVGTILIE